ncbi:MAG TPA: CFI-box-CTERM domain-containing protein [Polyangiales bacterium]|nr:CFI-box-CTERM domain-containing protein [Polyangiales bacterium]
MGILDGQMFARLSAPRRLRIGLLCGVFCVALVQRPAAAQSVLTFKYTPAPRAQIAIWIEDAQGRFLSTVALTEAVGYRGIGNRPGSSDMNSGYRWPYGRREGVLPIWAHRRASAPGAQLFPRVIFQNRVEGLASRTASDQSTDGYYCLQFDASKSGQDHLDAVSCATPFSSDKGRYLTEADVAGTYFEPYEPTPGQGVHQPLPLKSYYPPRMDVTRCTEPSCYDHADVAHFADDARAVMPDIDAVTIATPAGNSAQSILFSVPIGWSVGEYSAFIEVNVEGDYNASWSAQRFPTPKTPMSDRDSFSYEYGYAYRGQPSLVWKLSFTLGASGDLDLGVAEPVGRSSWDYWAQTYGALEPMSATAEDAISANVADSGVGRLIPDAKGRRFSVASGRFATSNATTAPAQPPRTSPAAGSGAPATKPASDAGVETTDATPPKQSHDQPAGDAAVSGEPRSPSGDNSIEPPSAVRELTLTPYADRLRAHKWVHLHMRAAQSELPLHAYEIRVSSDPIKDEQTFIRKGRQAKGASEAKEGPSYLQLPTDVPAGDWIDATIGDLSEETHYYVGVRARNVENVAGPLAFAEFTTPKREFATVTPCFVATVTYGSALAEEVSVLRRMRDRYLLSHGLGQALVSGYYRVGARLASWVAPHPKLRAAARVLLTPLVALARQLEAP